MKTYDLQKKKKPLYEALYDCMRDDILSGKLKAHEKLPSKRAFAANLGISTITVENAYWQLIVEGYAYSLPKKGYYVEEIDKRCLRRAVDNVVRRRNGLNSQKDRVLFDFSSNQTDVDRFPFTVWAKIMREVISARARDLLTASPYGGVPELREAIAQHLWAFRGMQVNPNQIIVGAGTEYLYGLIIKLLGDSQVYCVEDPGYKKLSQIYEINGAKWMAVGVDDKGLKVDDLRKTNANVAHVCPTHHFPTGITMPISRRQELLLWAGDESNRFIIEDDYDSEFRLKGKPIPSLQSIDTSGRVIYMNTFSKTLAPTIRISYMVLPEALTTLFYQKLSFYACTVSTFEQYTLAEFINRGHLEKHINRMRVQYRRKRQRVLDVIENMFSAEECRVIENESGLHFLLELHTNDTDIEVKEKLKQHHLAIQAVSEYAFKEENTSTHRFIFNYSNIDESKLEESLQILKKELFF